MKKGILKKKENKEKALAEPKAVVEKKTEREKVEERRKEVLSKGKKFKYPLQYSKHKLVVNTIIIALIAIVLVATAGWFALYKLQSTSDVLYRLTNILSLPVANVDGKDVRYSDYLMIFNSSVKTVGQSDVGVDVDALRREYKKIAMDDAEEYTYALKLAEELGVEVTNDQVEELFAKHRKMDGAERSEESFLKVLQDNFGLSKDEYKRMLYLSLVKMEVEKQIDEEAKSLVKKIEKLLAENGGNMMEAVAMLDGKVYYDETGGMIDSRYVDGGRAAAASKLEKGKISKAFVSSNGDGYYFVKLIDKNEDTSQINYASIKIPFTEFEKRMATIRDEGKIKEYIDVRSEEPEQEE